MAKVGAFLEVHPEALGAAGSAAITAPIPASYAQVRYHGIHSFHWTGPDGTRRAVRYEWAPDAGEAAVDPEATDRPADHLRRELAERLAAGPASFALWVVLAGDGGTGWNDPTERWPDDRERVEVGRLKLTGLGAGDAEDTLIFDPVNVPPGRRVLGRPPPCGPLPGLRRLLLAPHRRPLTPAAPGRRSFW